ncbi:MAG: lysophospholipid acyltransferase family protein [Myxococcales bacterium]
MGLLLFILRRLGASRARALLRLVATLAFHLGIRRRVALENLARAFPEKAEAERWALAKANYRHLGECAADFLRSPWLSDEELRAMVDPGDFELVLRCGREQRGVIGCTAHLGNFELFGVYAARNGVPLTILTRPLKGSANARWVGTRALAGIQEIHKGMDNLVAAVSAGQTLALLIDQNMLPKRAVFAPFFGTLAATTPAPAVVAERTGAPVLLTVLLKVAEGRYQVHAEGPYVFERKSGDRDRDLLEFTAMLNERLERVVRAHPEQWFWLHRRWKTRPAHEAG